MLIIAIVLLEGVYFSANTHVIILSSSSSVKAKTVSISSMFASLRIFSSSGSPQITIADDSSSAICSALILSFSIIFVLKPSVFSRSLAKCNPILPPPIIRIFLATFSSWPKPD